MKKVLLAGLLCCGILFLCSCATVNLDTRSLSHPVKMNIANTDDYTVVKSFVVHDKAGWVVIIPANPPAGDRQNYLSSILNTQIQEAGGDAVINVKIRIQNQPLDILTYICTFGLYHTRTVTVSGDVIKYN